MVIKKLISAFLVSTIVLSTIFSPTYASYLESPKENPNLENQSDLSNESPNDLTDVLKKGENLLDGIKKDLAESDNMKSNDSNNLQNLDSPETLSDNKVLNDNEINRGPIFYANYQSIVDGDFKKKDGSELDRVNDEISYQSDLNKDSTLEDIARIFETEYGIDQFSIAGFSDKANPIEGQDKIYSIYTDKDKKLSDLNEKELYAIWNPTNKYNISLKIADLRDAVNVKLIGKRSVTLYDDEGQKNGSKIENYSFELKNGETKTFTFPGDVEFSRNRKNSPQKDKVWQWNINVDGTEYTINDFTTINTDYTSNLIEYDITINAKKIETTADVPNTGIFDDIKPVILSFGLGLIGICLIAYQKNSISRRTYE